jgi:hypothetical protein
MRQKLFFAALLALATVQTASAQSELYPKHFDLEQVTLTDGPMKDAMELNIQMLMQYDVDRLLTPYVRQAGLAATTDRNSRYYQWLTRHPNFKNWGGDAGFDLSGHVGGHYLSALALAYAASHDDQTRAKLKERMDYMLAVMKDCQDQYDNDTEGLYGFIGGQPINDSWKKLYKGDLSGIQANWGWVPFYCQHKILAGLRDAYLYGNSDTAKEMFRKLSDWSVNLIARVGDDAFEGFLNCEHGGMNESMLDAYQLFGDTKYLTAAKKYTHKAMLNGMQTLNKSFLDGKHANTQVPKYIGMERIFEQDATATAYKKAAENFWQDVAMNRTVCIGGNSVNEHFLAAANGNRYIDQPDGPESCNTNNMLKFSEMLFDRTEDAKYVDFYEQAMWNHILSTQDPKTGGYVYFTTLRPQGYRIYSKPNAGMWCCVGTGMENHSKYGHFIYTHDGDKTLYVNLFTPSKLASDDFAIIQETQFPFSPSSALTIGKAGSYTIAVRHPSWSDGFSVTVNGEKLSALTEAKGYVMINRKWKKGDVITLQLPMQLRYEECPNYTDYIAFKYGPILLGANTTNGSEQLQNLYGGEGRMDHSPGAMGRQKNLLSAPLLIGNRADVLSRIKSQDLSRLTFTIDAKREGVDTYKWTTLTLQPFYQIHHDRYMCYWYQQTPENFAKSDMAQTEAANEALKTRTIDFVATGEQQSEAGHEYNYSADSGKGNYNGESYRDAQAGGYVQFTLFNKDGISEGLAIMCRFTTADKGRVATLTVDGQKIADIIIPDKVKKSENGFFNVEYPIPSELIKDSKGNVKTKFKVRLSATGSTPNPGLYYLRLVSGYAEQSNAYRFRANDWTTGDPARVAASRFSYDAEHNTITIQAGTGTNNVALSLNHEGLDYTISREQTYLVVRGTNLKTTTGSSYLWWLNGTNRGSQVAPTTTSTITLDDTQQQVFAWDMTKSGLYDNFSGDRPGICFGSTIFGLTSTTGTSTIHDITFVASPTDYITTTTGIQVPHTSLISTYHTLQGIPANSPQKGLYITPNGKKVVF